MRESKAQPDAFFFGLRRALNGLGEEPALQGDLKAALADYTLTDSSHDYWRGDAPQSMVIEEVEEIWSAIDERDDWAPLHSKVAALRRMGEGHGDTPETQGHTQ